MLCKAPALPVRYRASQAGSRASMPRNFTLSTLENNRPRLLIDSGATKI